MKDFVLKIRRRKIKPMLKQYTEYQVIGSDSETCRGKPITIQFFGAGIKQIRYVNEKNVMREFFAFCNSLKSASYVIYAHNLNFDSVSYFYPVWKKFYEEEFDFTFRGWRIKGYYGQPTYFILRKGNKLIYLLDTAAYFKGSLDNLAKTFVPGLPKLGMPKGLGEKIFKKGDKKFEAYALRDAEITYYIGLKIQDMHREFDITQSISNANMAGKIFRRKFLNQEMVYPIDKITYAALNAYHGGKNLVTVPPSIYKNVTCLDIISAYPTIMSRLPNFYDPACYMSISGTDVDEPVPENGVYKISGKARTCKWPVLFDPAFKPIQGEFSDIWTTGYEINEALQKREIKISCLFGYWYDTEYEKTSHRPLKEYVDFFYEHKARSEKIGDKVNAFFYKILLNSLYGKFIETRTERKSSEYFDLDAKKYKKEKEIISPGALFYPFIAALVTGWTRAYIHALEHKYKSLHTSTDGIMTQQKNIKIGKPKLGGIKIEFVGDFLILRNKLYIGYNTTKGKFKSKLLPGKYANKFAFHGCKMSVEELENAWITKNFNYTYTRVNKLRESVRRNLQVNNFEKVNAKINLKGV
jgi:hypothetical protein